VKLQPQQPTNNQHTEGNFMKRTLITILISAATVFAQSARDATTALRAIDSAITAGINYHDYSVRVADAKVKLDRVPAAKRGKLEPIMHTYILAERVWGATPEMHETLKAAGAEILATPDIANCPPMPLAIKRATEIKPDDVPYALGLFLSSTQLPLFKCAANKLAAIP
jgi:hypothetical protein